VSPSLARLVRITLALAALARPLVAAEPTATPPPAFLLASPREGKPAAALGKRDLKRLDEAQAALEKRDLAKAEKLLKAGPPASLAYRTGRAYLAILRGKLDQAPPPLGATLDLAAVRGLCADQPGALAGPRQLARLLCGLGSPALTRARLTRHPLFAAAEDRPFAEVLAWCATVFD